MKDNLTSKRIAFICCIFVLTGCGADIDDLVEYTEEIKNNSSVVVTPAPVFKTLDSVDYNASDLRDPFQRAVANVQVAEVAKVPNCSQPDINRAKETLESYGLDALSMSGAFSTNGKQFGLVIANDGTLHKVTTGSYIGLFNGRVTSVSENSITITEYLPDGAGCFKPKTAQMSLSGATGNDNNV